MLINNRQVFRESHRDSRVRSSFIKAEQSKSNPVKRAPKPSFGLLTKVKKDESI